MKKFLLLAGLAAATMTATATPIVETPEGTLYENVYVDNDYSFLIKGNVSGYTEAEGGRTQIVVDENLGRIYIHNVIEFYPEMDAWIVGDLADDGTATFVMPQEIYKNETNGNVYSVNMLIPVVDGNTLTLTPNTEAPDLVMQWDGTTLKQVMPDQTMPTDYDRYLGYIGVVSSGTDAPFYGEAGLNYTVYPDPVDIPKGTQLEEAEYSLTYTDEWNDNYTELATIFRQKDGDGIWIAGLNREAPDQVVVATEDADGNLVIASGQFTGYTQGVFTFFYGCSISRDEQHKLVCEWTDEVVLKLNEGKYEAEGSMIFNVGDRTPQFGLGLKNAVLTPLEDKEYTPANPEIEGPESDGTEVVFEDGIYMYILCFYLDAVSTDGEAIDSANLYYTVYLNGEQIPVGMMEEMDEVPFGYNNDMDVYNIGSWNMIMGFTESEVESLGVQAIYKNKNGVETKSQLVTWENPESGVANVSTGAEVVSTQYFDLTGRAVTEPSGLCVRRTVRADGSVEVSKTIVRK